LSAALRAIQALECTQKVTGSDAGRSVRLGATIVGHKAGLANCIRIDHVAGQCCGGISRYLQLGGLQGINRKDVAMRLVNLRRAGGFAEVQWARACGYCSLMLSGGTAGNQSYVELHIRPISGLPAITFHQPDPAASSANRVRNRLVSVLRRASTGKQLGCHVTTAGRPRGRVEVVQYLKQPALGTIVAVGEEADVAAFWVIQKTPWSVSAKLRLATGKLRG